MMLTEWGKQLDKSVRCPSIRAHNLCGIRT
mgnify:CR=1 FL=1